MKHVTDVMSSEVAFCHMGDTMNRAAQLMWERDCGCVPIVDDRKQVIGIITDRDICMATYTQGKLLSELPVSLACSREVQTCKASDTLEHAEKQMTKAQVRRLPVADERGELVGVVSIADLAHHSRRAAPTDKHIQRTLSAVLAAVTRRRHSADASARPGEHTTDMPANR
jgi:CBS domain-containing protein